MKFGERQASNFPSDKTLFPPPTMKHDVFVNFIFSNREYLVPSLFLSSFTSFATKASPLNNLLIIIINKSILAVYCDGTEHIKIEYQQKRKIRKWEYFDSIYIVGAAHTDTVHSIHTDARHKLCLLTHSLTVTVTVIEGDDELLAGKDSLLLHFSLTNP